MLCDTAGQGLQSVTWVLLLVATAVSLLALFVIGNALLRDHALTAETPEERLARLEPHWRLVRPRTAEPAPVAILVSGCDVPGDSMNFWAAMLADVGWASLVLNRHRPRRLDRLQAWRLVCSGQALSGAERAGDIAVALSALADMPGVDASRVALVGASHGGWAAMELVDHLRRETPPPGLIAWPEPPEAALARVSAVALLYPYCGVLNGGAVVQDADLQGPVPLLMVLAGDDTIVSTARCEATAERLATAGAAVQVHTLARRGSWLRPACPCMA